MCIVLLTTAHPKYALIVLDNRDEYILRPTSPPHWWTLKASSLSKKNYIDGTDSGKGGETQQILSSRDLQRATRGTWLGITKSGHIAVLTNFRESAADDQSISGTRSRGGMVTAWLGSSSKDSVEDFVQAMMADDGYKGVGGFSLICGKLRRRPGKDGEADGVEPLAILSNRAEHPDHVPRICGGKRDVVGLSNTVFENSDTWPKVSSGKALLGKVIAEDIEKDMDEEELRAKLFSILDTDTMQMSAGKDLQEHMDLMRQSIFIPLLGNEEHQNAMTEAAKNGHVNPNWEEAVTNVTGAEPPVEPGQSFQEGMYGTQRQTVILVDHDGKVTFTERSLWDEYGNAIPRGKGDKTFCFTIDEWDRPTSTSMG